MNLKAISTSLVCAGLVCLAGCSQSGSSDEQKAQSQSSTSSNGTTQAMAPSLPASLFASSAPTDSKPLIDVKADAKQGDQVSFVARVGGRIESFVDGRAMFFVTDSSILSCDQLHGDTCPTPWDYCCEPKDNLIKHMATVQVVDDATAGPMKLSLENKHGLKPLRTVHITGTVQTIDETGNMVVNAESIFVEES